MLRVRNSCSIVGAKTQTSLAFPITSGLSTAVLQANSVPTALSLSQRQSKSEVTRTVFSTCQPRHAINTRSFQLMSFVTSMVADGAMTCTIGRMY